MLLKRLCTVVLLGGLLGLVPTAAQAAPVTPPQVVQPDPVPAAGYDLFHKDRDDDHYRCMYRCDERRDGKHRGHKYHRHKYDHRHRYCWYYDRWGWYQARCRGGRDRHRHDH